MPARVTLTLLFSGLLLRLCASAFGFPFPTTDRTLHQLPRANRTHAPYSHINLGRNGGALGLFWGRFGGALASVFCRVN